MSLRTKRALARIWRPAPSHPRRVVLLYHAVGSGPLATLRAAFEEQMKWLDRHAEVLPLDDLLAGRGTGALRVAITFDDGYASVYSEAARIMAKHGMVGTVYLNTGWIGDAERKPSDPALGHYEGEEFLTWPEVLALSASGWTIGSHGVEHLDITSLPKQRVHEELVGSRRVIEHRTGQDCLHFAYTWGRYDEGAVAALAATGYRHAVCTLHGPIRHASPPFLIPRIDIQRQYDLRDFERILQGRWDFLGWIQRARRLARRRHTARAA